MDPLLDFAPCGYATVSDDGHLEQVNATLAEMLGTTPALLVGLHVDSVFTPASRIFYQTHVFPVLRLQGRVHEVYISLLMPGGPEVPVLLNAVRSEREGRRVSDWIVVPMRQRNEYENKILEARRIAEDAVRAKDEFLALASHELRAPLSAIRGWAHLLGAAALDESGRRRAAEAIERSVRQQSRLVDDILDLARIASGKLRVDVAPLHLQPVVEGAIEGMASAASAKSIRVDTDIDSREVSVLGDSDRLHQVFWNLLGNAIKFTPSGGSIRVRLRRVESGVEVSVIDTGHGIEPNFLPFVFERFRQAHAGTSRSGGLGLGLAISSQIVELHGGTICAESEGQGKGATFTVRLPLVR